MPLIPKKIPSPLIGTLTRAARTAGGRNVNNPAGPEVLSPTRNLHGTPSSAQSGLPGFGVTSDVRPPSTGKIAPSANRIQAAKIATLAMPGLHLEKPVTLQKLRFMAYGVGRKALKEPLSPQQQAKGLSLTESLQNVRTKIVHRGSVKDDPIEARLDHLAAEEMAANVPGKRDPVYAETAKAMEVGVCDNMTAAMQEEYAARLKGSEVLETIVVETPQGKPPHKVNLLKPDPLQSDPSREFIIDGMAGGRRNPEPAILAEDARYGTVPREPEPYASVNTETAEDMLDHAQWVRGLVQAESPDKVAQRRDRFRAKDPAEAKENWDSEPVFSADFCDRASRAVTLALEADRAMVEDWAREEIEGVLGLEDEKDIAPLVDRVINEALNLDKVQHEETPPASPI